MKFSGPTWRELRRRADYLFQRFTLDHCSQKAAALTYMSLFALVPLLTVLYTMASAVPAFQGMEEKVQVFLFENLMPKTSSEIQNYLDEFSRQAKNLTGAGIAFLMVTAVLMLHNIEKALNLIWRASENRGPVSSFLLYWAVLSLAPVMIGAALALSTYLTTFTDVLSAYDVFGLRGLLLNMAPILLAAAGFTLIYVAVPNCQVPFRHALIGGFVAGLAFHIARGAFTVLVVHSSYTFIYGAFAAVPLFLLWIYLSWNIVLMGGILVHSLSAYQSEEQAGRPRLLKALDVLYLFWERQKSGRAVRELELLRSRHQVTRGLDSDTWRELRDIFIERRLVVENSTGHYMLARDLHDLSLWQLKEWVNSELPLDTEQPEKPLAWQNEAYQLLRQQRDQQRELLEVSLAELFSR